MMRNHRSIAGALAALALAAAPAVGQVGLPTDNTAYGTTSGESLLLGAGARGMALGGAFAALATDVSALYYNPAGLAELERPGGIVSVYDYVAETRYSWAGLAFPMSGGVRTIGFQIGNFGFHDEPVTTVENPDGDGTKYSVSQTFVGLSYAQNFSDRFSAGFTAKFITDKLGRTDASAFAADFGTSFHASAMNRPIRASFVIQNLGSALKHDGTALDVEVQRPPPPGTPDVPQEGQPAQVTTKEWNLPVTFRVGVALDFLSSAQQRFTGMAEFSQPNSSRAGFAIGGEYMMSDIGKSGFFVAGRGSWAYQSDNNLSAADAGAAFASDKDGQKGDGLAAGLGVGYRRGNFGLGVDYAYRGMGNLGGTNMVSFSVSW